MTSLYGPKEFEKFLEERTRAEKNENFRLTKVLFEKLNFEISKGFLTLDVSEYLYLCEFLGKIKTNDYLSFEIKKQVNYAGWSDFNISEDQTKFSVLK